MGANFERKWVKMRKQGVREKRENLFSSVKMTADRFSQIQRHFYYIIWARPTNCLSYSICEFCTEIPEIRNLNFENLQKKIQNCITQKLLTAEQRPLDINCSTCSHELTGFGIFKIGPIVFELWANE